MRVLATTRDRSLFDAVDSYVDVISVDGLRPEETKELLFRNGISSSCPKSIKAAHLAHEVTSGNPALLVKMAKLARGSSVTLAIHFCS